VQKRETPASPKSNRRTQHVDARPLSVTVSKVIPTGAEALYDLVADITSMHKFSPENTEGVWLKGATGPVVGAQFKGSNQLGKAKWSTKPK
jgi:hypothetical protein